MTTFDNNYRTTGATATGLTQRMQCELSNDDSVKRKAE